MVCEAVEEADDADVVIFNFLGASLDSAKVSEVDRPITMLILGLEDETGLTSTPVSDLRFFAGCVETFGRERFCGIPLVSVPDCDVEAAGLRFATNPAFPAAAPVTSDVFVGDLTLFDDETYPGDTACDPLTDALVRIGGTGD